MEYPFTRRIAVELVENGIAYVRDRNAPYHCHPVAESALPQPDEWAGMTESQYDDAVLAAVYA